MPARGNLETAKLVFVLDTAPDKTSPPVFITAKSISLLLETNTAPKLISSVDMSAIGYEGGSETITSSMLGLLLPYVLVPTKRIETVCPT